MKTRIVAMVVVATTALMSLPALAARGWSGDGSGKFGFVGGLDAEFGGDNVVTVTYKNGDTQNLEAGRGVGFNAGLHGRPFGGRFDLLGTIGYKYATTAASNADIHLDRVVFKLIGTVDLPHSFWIGAGPVLHSGIHFKGDNFAPDFNFDDSVGVSVLVGWRWVALTYTNMSYKVQKPYTGTLDASSVGLTLMWRGG